MKIGDFTVKAMPSTPMTDDKMRAQIAFVSEAAEATRYFTEDELEATANEKTMLDFIGSFDFGVYSAQGKIILADPLDGPEGYGITVGTIAEAYSELVMSGMIDGDRPSEPESEQEQDRR